MVHFFQAALKFKPNLLSRRSCLRAHVVYSSMLSGGGNGKVSSSGHIPVKKILTNDFPVLENVSKTSVHVKGWVKSVRGHKDIRFIDVNDGSCLSNLQIVVSTNSGEIDMTTKPITIGSSIEVCGTVVEVTKKDKSVVNELHAQDINVVGECPAAEYPLQKKYQSLEFLRENLHLRSRTNTFGALTRVRSCLSHGMHSFFKSEDFFQVFTPILTGNDAEGGGEQFRILSGDNFKDPNFFGKPSFLTVSGQLHAEIYACSMSKVYTFGPTFRAENSNTTRHLAEFWMIEPEMAFANLDQNMDVAERATKHTVKQVLNDCNEEINFFSKVHNIDLEDRLCSVVNNDFHRISYTDAIDILLKSSKKFIYDVHWGMDLKSEHERYLAETYFGSPVFVTDYPSDIKAFYMRENEDKKTVSSMDLLVPSIGELLGGSVREDREEILKRKMIKAGLISDETQDMQWYLDLRKFGSVPHAGWGMGFERLVLFVTGIENIRDAIPFPRTPKTCLL